MTTSITVLAQAVDALGSAPFIVAALTKGSLLVLVAVALTRLLARAPAAARHLVWTLSIGAVLLLPAISRIPWRIELPVLGAARDAFTPAPQTTPRQAPNERRPVNDVRSAPETPVPSATVTATVDRPPSATVPSLPTDPASLLLGAWLAGMAWMIGRLAIGVINVRRMVKAGSPATGADWDWLIGDAHDAMGARAATRIVISERAAMPFTYGLVRPTIVLPSSAEEWTPERRRSVLLHELAHVRRRDLVTNAVVQLASAVYWFHPLVRFASRRVRIEAERACDALVVAAGTRPSDYAGDLLEIARTMRSSATGAVALAMARRSDFEGRLLAILAPDAGRNVLTAARAALIALSFVTPAVAIAAAAPASRAVPNVERAPTVVARADSSVLPAPESLAATSSSRAFIAPPQQTSAQEPQTSTRTSRGDTAVPALLTVLKDESAAVRLAAVESLGNLNDPRAVDALVQAVRTDTDARVREAAAEALGQINSARAVPGLTAALGSEKVAAVRVKIVWALGEMHDQRSLDALIAATKDSEVAVRREAAQALGQIESQASGPALIALLRDSDAETRKEAASALGEIKPADAVPALSAIAKDPNAEVRKEVNQALGQIQDKRALPALAAATTDAEVEVRREAVEAIGELDDLKTAPPALIAALKDEDRDVRKEAAEAIGNIEDEAAVPALIPLTRDSSSEVKHAAVEALSNIGGARAIEVMAALLKDDDPEIRKLAAQALGKK
jgi:HEAT repeat protein/beta-lactamase regulating signal transducer with metallopeptidase domain